MGVMKVGSGDQKTKNLQPIYKWQRIFIIEKVGEQARPDVS